MQGHWQSTYHECWKGKMGELTQSQKQWQGLHSGQQRLCCKGGAFIIVRGVVWELAAHPVAKHGPGHALRCVVVVVASPSVGGCWE